MDVTLRYTHHLAGLLAEAAAASTRLEAVTPSRLQQLAVDARRTVARLSARLDGSPLSDATADAVDAGEPLAPPPPPDASLGWSAALRLEGMGTQQVAAVEYANLLAAGEAEPVLAPRLFEEPAEVLATVHGTVCRGLVAPEVVGRPRRTAQAVHDGAQGMVVFNVPDPERVPGLLADLAGWLGRGSATVPALIVAAVVHERLLEWQPFEAGNGRVARAAARLVLRARGLDPHGVAVAEHAFVADPGGYYREVAATIHRRGDLGPWCERYAEAVIDGFRIAAAADGGPQAPVPPPRAAAIAAALPGGETMTVAEYADRARVSRDTAHRELRQLTEAGALTREPRSSGLRFRRPASAEARA